MRLILQLESFSVNEYLIEYSLRIAQIILHFQALVAYHQVIRAQT